MNQTKPIRVDVVDFAPTPVIYAASKGDRNDIPAAAGRAFARLEAAILPHGRKIYGYWHDPALEYRACYGRRTGDDPRQLGLGDAVIDGGRYRRARIRAAEAIEQIPGAYAMLTDLGGVSDDGRPWFEFYRRHDRVDVLIPISAPS